MTVGAVSSRFGMPSRPAAASRRDVPASWSGARHCSRAGIGRLCLPMDRDYRGREDVSSVWPSWQTNATGQARNGDRPAQLVFCR
jgi:hypothetical protein